MNTKGFKELLAILAVVAVPIVSFALWTWAAEPRNLAVLGPLALRGLPVLFVAGHLGLIILGLALRPNECVRVLALLLMGLDVLLAALLAIGLLLSLTDPGFGSQLVGGMCLLLLLPIVGLGSGLLTVYRKRLA